MAMETVQEKTTITSEGEEEEEEDGGGGGGGGRVNERSSSEVDTKQQQQQQQDLRKGTLFKGRNTSFHWINEVNGDSLPRNYIMTNKSILHPSVKLDENFLYGCSCEGGCKSKGPKMCPFCLYFADSYYEKKTERWYPNATPAVLGLARATPCSNRLVQLSDVSKTVELQVFRTEKKGWGLRTLTPIPKYSYVCEYIGEIIAEEIAQQRGEFYDVKGCSYLWTQGDVHPSQPTLMPYTIDATDYGNISRFINHSCEANLLAVSVRVETRDVRIPRIGIFTMRNIKAFEELTIDYNYYIDKTLPPNLQIPCKCGMPRCRGRLR
eukprot:jgi/Bigna1/69038/fgenesh1_pg.7_\